MRLIYLKTVIMVLKGREAHIRVKPEAKPVFHKPRRVPQVVEAELRTFEENGIINDLESDIIENTLSLKGVKIKDILTPRSVVFTIQKNTLIKDILDDERTYKFSRVPVYDESIDNIIGMVLTKKIFKQAIKNPNATMESIMIDVDSINENIPVSKALSSFTKVKGHMLIVTDGYDQTEGIVTLEDCIETLLGLEIMDELDTTEDMRKLASSKMKAKRKEKEKL